MIEKENKLLQEIANFYQNVLGSKEVLILDNISFVISGILNPSFNICSLYGHIGSEELDALEKTWRGPMTILTNIENNFAFSKTFYRFGFVKYMSFPILYKKLELSDFDWGKQQIKNVDGVVVKRVESLEDLQNFSKVCGSVYNLPESSILSAMKKNILDKKETSLYVGYFNNTPIASVASLNSGEDCFIWNMSIIPEFRKSNIMKKMGYEMFQNNFKNKVLNTYTFTTAPETAGLFKKMGAEKIGDVYLWIRQ
jgi:hypothetical protein